MNGGMEVNDAAEATQFSQNRDFLKHVTGAAHATAEKSWFSSSAFASRVAYSDWLSALFEAHATLGAAATKSSALKSYRNAEERRRRAIALDLGFQSMAERSTCVPSQSWSWGVLYALNGSALGASILLKTGVLNPQWPKSYLNEMRLFATSGQLKYFFEHLNEEELDREAMADGAIAVFDLIASSK